MPISDMWKEANGLNTMGEIDSNGSCDSVSDNSLEYLSPEERACLMYLEETIQSLDIEDDSGLSNDESDKLPARGNVANKVAHFAASLRLNKLPSQDVPKSQSKDTSSSLVQNEILNSKAPTPFVLANHNSRIQSRPELAAFQINTSPKVACESNQLHQEAPRVPSEVSVVVIPPPYKIKGGNDTVEEEQNKHQPESVAHRGPLSYEALVHLRKSASMRRTEAKTEEQQVSTNKDHEGNISRSYNSQAMTTRSSKPNPPPVAPKPKMKTPMSQEGASDPKVESTMPSSEVLTVDKLMNPEKVRLQALCKLGILKEDTENPICQQLKHSESSVQSRTTSEPPRVPAKPAKKINQPVQSYNPVHQRSVSDLSTASSYPQHESMTSIWKSATLERTGVGLSDSNITVSNAVSLNQQSSTSTLGTKKPFTDTQTDTSESTKPASRSRGFTVPVPSIGSDRREALRKLGLLKY
ncbi:hypothetical protein H4Q32_023214 [Labeo rohita]|uniref:Specifically androgen-regulated gene protein-like n=1 Tax=Labeo rohita TaxID=84645 RepID=A0ABQ8M828_LABRO|nr:hypothetical protein H4Q32_023214 [Labeo rohita]